MKRKILSLLFLVFIIFTGAMLLLREDARNLAGSGLVEETRFLMGTSWTIKVPLERGLQRETVLAAVENVFAELAAIENLMSEWRPDTPISLVNENAGIRPVEVSDELIRIIRRGIEYGELSGGAFDITWRGMGRIWTFGEDFRIPGVEEVAEAVKRVDFRKIVLEGNTVYLPETGMALGLGGIAKGYAIDRAGQTLTQAGIGDFLIDGGGDILTSGSVQGRPWKVGIRDPRGERTALIRKLSLSGGAVVTSGDYERFRIVDGRRYHHIIDPRTGWPADKCRSVTVYSSTAERADVLATAVFVMGPENGLAMLARIGDAEGFVIDSAGVVSMTRGFDALIEK